jgi:enoyl-[acyl-carrier-protein] reductase (NADH)
MSVTTWSLIAACRYAHPLRIRSSSPRVVALTSACSHHMTPHYHVAGIAKAALESAVIEQDNVASAITFLCSPLARNLTGEIATVDGGFSRSNL